MVGEQPTRAMAIRIGPLLISGALLATACASNGDEMRVVVPQKTTYLHAEAADGGTVDVPPRVLEEVRPTVPDGIDDDPAPTVVARFAIDTKGRIGEIEISQATDHRLSGPASEAIARWRIRAALRDGQAIAVVATVQITFDLALRDDLRR
jgi:hypothetical protein